MFRPHHAIKSPLLGQLPQSRQRLGKYGPILQGGEVSCLCQRRYRSHGGAIAANVLHVALTRQKFHRRRQRGGPGRYPSLHRISLITPASRQRQIVPVAVTASEQHHVAPLQWAVGRFPSQDWLQADEWADTRRRLIQQVFHVNDACLANKLPNGCSMNVLAPKSPRIGQPQFRPCHGMGRHVHLRAGVTVDHQRLHVVGAFGSYLLDTFESKSRK